MPVDAEDVFELEAMRHDGRGCAVESQLGILSRLSVMAECTPAMA